MLVAQILIILEDVVEMVESLGVQKTYTRDHVRHGASGESSARKADEDDLISVGVVIADEAVCQADVLKARSGAVHMHTTTPTPAPAGAARATLRVIHTRSRPMPNTPPVNWSILEPLLPKPG